MLTLKGRFHAHPPQVQMSNLCNFVFFVKFLRDRFGVPGSTVGLVRASFSVLPEKK